jgi:hypothetical protein
VRSLWNDNDCLQVIERLARIDAASVPRWGVMTADRMLIHLAENLRVAIGELTVSRRRGTLLRLWPFKQVAVYCLRMPKGLQTPLDLVSGAPMSIPVARQEVRRLLWMFTARRDFADWPEHPIFGPLSRNAWGAHLYSHFDHHLKQFGA